ncbi:MAG: zinc-ribbon and DUF3426 domain-containing protein [Woeseiaceae bacterium]|nr:zinc-ribbon and DUF3426 domain-containing protein [Woeseiaceae bacterium]
MYTQCPDCEIAFKVTADILKQAAGMVRCGGCGNAFNALAYLSEQMPRLATPQKANAPLPELRPELIETDDGLPQAISAEQSAALLKTLDELAGSNIRIEDTGVEWRVLDQEDAAAPAADDDDGGQFSSAGSDDLNKWEIVNVDEYLDDTETPIDEFLTATPEVIDAPEIFSAAANPVFRAVVEELRFDDNTPLPDDFDREDEPFFVSTHESKPPWDGVEDRRTHVPQEATADFSLSQPDEWTDILGEFQELAPDIAAPANSTVESSSAGDGDLIEDEVPYEEPAPAARADVLLDMDAQFALQAEAMGIDLSGINKIEIGDEPDEPDEKLIEDFEESLEIELEDELDDELLDELEDELDDELLDELEDELDIELLDELEDELDDELAKEADFDKEIAQLDLIIDQPEFMDEPVIAHHAIEDELATNESDDDSEDVSEDQSGEHLVPPMTEEEHTVNMMIDQDLMAFAIEDEDGFASTIVIQDKDTEKKARVEQARMAKDDVGGDEDDEAPGFETIIMEGDFVRSAFDSEKLAADAAAAATLAKLTRSGGDDKARYSGGTRYGVIAGLVLLVIVLAIQAMHQSRESLATIPAFSNTVGQVYRALGQPVQPAWNITGWRFEATKGNVEGDEEELTIYSRLGNNSDGPLPYPLISISLTDRFEETIGSRVLEPAEYLPTDLDPRKLVPPGNTFNAVITIKSATESATGFKLNVCYRLSDGQLRCAIDDFK